MVGADLDDDLKFTSNLFFLYLLPPIVLESGYFLKSGLFFDNLGTILVYAVAGTLWNTFSLGASLYAVSAWGWVPEMDNLSFVQALFFASLTAAVDPVAVLAVFEEIHVNEKLHILVFGESILNDAVSVVLYRMFEAFTEKPEVEGRDIGLGFAAFFTVSLGALAIGITMGLLTSFLTKYSKHVGVVEPMIVFSMGYAAYVVTDLLHWSGIISGLFCAMLIRRYAENNITHQSKTTTRQLMKNVALMSEAIIFIFLGIHTVSSDSHDWNTAFIGFTLVFISIYRAVGVFVLTAILNPFHRDKISFVDQFTMAYGGLRGAVSFSLVLIIDDCFPHKNVMFTTTVAVVFFTVFVQGITIKPIVKALRVRLVKESKMSVSHQLHERVFTNVVSGIENISGDTSFISTKTFVSWLNSKYITPLLLRKPESADHEIVEAFIAEQYAEVDRKLKKMEEKRERLAKHRERHPNDSGSSLSSHSSSPSSSSSSSSSDSESGEWLECCKPQQIDQDHTFHSQPTITPKEAHSMFANPSVGGDAYRTGAHKIGVITPKNAQKKAWKEVKRRLLRKADERPTLNRLANLVMQEVSLGVVHQAEAEQKESPESLRESHEQWPDNLVKVQSRAHEESSV